MRATRAMICLGMAAGLGFAACGGNENQRSGQGAGQGQGKAKDPVKERRHQAAPASGWIWSRRA